MKSFKLLLLALLVLLLSFISLPAAFAQDIDIPSSWSTAKNRADDKVYGDHKITIYCGCEYNSDNDSDGSGKMTAESLADLR